MVCLGTIPYALRAQPASIDIHTQHANHASSYKLLAVGASRGVPKDLHWNKAMGTVTETWQKRW